MEDKYKTPNSDMDIYKKTQNSNKTPSRHGQNVPMSSQKQEHVVHIHQDNEETVSTSKEADE